MFIVRLVSVLKLFYFVKYVLDFRHVLCSATPKMLLRIIQAQRFGVSDFVHGGGFVGSPGELFVEELEQNKVPAPEVVAPR